MRKSPYTISNFICPECGGILPLPRMKKSRREKGHMKNIFCPYCQKEQTFQETRNDEFYKSMSGEILKR